MLTATDESVVITTNATTRQIDLAVDTSSLTFISDGSITDEPLPQSTGALSSASQKFLRLNYTYLNGDSTPLDFVRNGFAANTSNYVIGDVVFGPLQTDLSKIFIRKTAINTVKGGTSVDPEYKDYDLTIGSSDNSIGFTFAPVSGNPNASTLDVTVDYSEFPFVSTNFASATSD